MALSYNDINIPAISKFRHCMTYYGQIKTALKTASLFIIKLTVECY